MTAGRTPFTAATVADWRADGCITLTVICQDQTCKHEGRVEIDTLPTRLTYFEVKQRCRCAHCPGHEGVEIRVEPSQQDHGATPFTPSWRDRHAGLPRV